MVGPSLMLFKHGAACYGYYEMKCVEYLKYCPSDTSIVVTATTSAAPNYSLPTDAEQDR
jgi:hypothetical protein